MGHVVKNQIIPVVKYAFLAAVINSDNQTNMLMEIIKQKFNKQTLLPNGYSTGW